MLQSYLGGLVEVVVGDITAQQVDAIVNAANSSLMGGGGVDGAIHRAGGPTILEECKEIRRTQYPQGLPTGDAVLTSAGNLPSKFVIHTVGPVCGRHAGSEANLLAACYTNSLQLAMKHDVSTIAFPAISTGVYGYPLNEAAGVSSKAIKLFLSKQHAIEEVRLVFFHDADAEVFVKNQVF
ncbi:MAG TPA: O-acetyl-ADP-ribose deacetylase [Pyrinomonadaceae bacterium]|nr:O-acetyl-ADP-ribose deacetylase [Pyrinomonadaceae bacterium]